MMTLKISIGCSFCFFFFLILIFRYLENKNMHLDRMNFSKQYGVSYNVGYNI